MASRAAPAGYVLCHPRRDYYPRSTLETTIYKLSLAAAAALATFLLAAASANAYNGCWHRIDNYPDRSEVRFSCPKDAPGTGYSATLVYHTPSGERRTLKSVASTQGEPAIGVMPRSRGTYFNVINWTYHYW